MSTPPSPSSIRTAANVGHLLHGAAPPMYTAFCANAPPRSRFNIEWSLSHLIIAISRLFHAPIRTSTLSYQLPLTLKSCLRALASASYRLFRISITAIPFLPVLDLLWKAAPADTPFLAMSFRSLSSCLDDWMTHLWERFIKGQSPPRRVYLPLMTSLALENFRQSRRSIVMASVFLSKGRIRAPLRACLYRTPSLPHHTPINHDDLRLKFR
ncbi:hypothetical protein BJ912DRAFT_1083146 [Pholiota molesta]|nr:hypothetical protein BJ912DRAFT_1083146 [Pholiota molesta]